MSWDCFLVFGSLIPAAFAAGVAYGAHRTERDFKALDDKVMEIKGWTKIGPGKWEKAENVDLS